MKESVWAESLLKAYTRLNFYIEQINKRVNMLALTRPSIQYGTTTEVIADKIFSLIDKKKIFFKTKFLVEDILASINKKYAYVIKMKFIQGKTSAEIADYFKVSERSVRRYIIEGLNFFKKYVKKQIEPCNVLSDCYKNQTWMASIDYDCVRHKLWKKDKKKYKKFVKECKFEDLKTYESLYSYNI